MEYLDVLDRLDDLDNQTTAHALGVKPLTEAELVEIKAERIRLKCIIADHHD